VIAVIAAVGVYFAVSPTIEKRKMIATQNELLDSILQGGGIITLDNSFINTPLNFYDESGSDENSDDERSRVDTVMEEAPVITVFFGETQGEANPADNAVITGIGILTIERINARLPVTDGVSDAQLRVAVGHVPQTAPIGGEGNAVIIGHRSYTFGHYFNRLGEVEIGDIIKYQPRNGDEMVFEVFEILEVLPDSLATFEDFGEARVLTLHTCTPIRVASHRLLVRAIRIH